MSVDATGAPEAIELSTGGDANFASFMDTLVAAEDAETGGPSSAAAHPPAGGDGQPAAPAQGTGAAGAATGAPAAGESGVLGLPAGEADPAGAGSSEDLAGALDADSLAPKWGEISTALETVNLETAQRAALDEIRVEYPKYIEALEKHPRLLVGQEVPAIGKGDGAMETLRDSEDAESWQSAVKAELIKEVQDRAGRKSEDSNTNMSAVHASIELFQNNSDLIPGTRQFDKDLANRFATLATPYELRVDGKLYGYTIPPQPLITQLRSQLVAERAAAAAPALPTGAPAAGAPGRSPAAPAAVVTPVVDPPQAGISSKAGAGSEAEDFSTLFGTIGLPNLRI